MKSPFLAVLFVLLGGLAGCGKGSDPTVTSPLDTRTTGIFITRENFAPILKREGIIE